MFFGIDRARFLTRQLLGGPRHADLVRSVSPAIENKLVYLRFRGKLVAARAGGEIPSRAAALGAGLRVLEGEWHDAVADSAWIAPTTSALYDELDHFHLPPVADSSWGEWHYFNITASANEWWYVTYLIGGAVPHGRWGGQLLVSHRKPDGRYDHFTAALPSDSVGFDTTRADLTLGSNTVRQRDGRYALTATAKGPAGVFTLDLTVTPEQNRYFPPVDLREGEYLSGYVVPALSGNASGRVCVGRRCTTLDGVPAYHDHNWGVWRNVTWDWGAARGKRFNLLYGGVYAPDDSAALRNTGTAKLLVALVDSLGVRQILRAGEVRYERPVASGLRAGGPPTAFSFIATRDADTVRVTAQIADYQATARTSAGMGVSFLQMRGAFQLEGKLGGVAVKDEGTGFFETYLGAPR
jgi:hypothetical protein